MYDSTKALSSHNFNTVEFANEQSISNVVTSSQYYKFRNEFMIPTNATIVTAFYNDYWYNAVGGQILLSGGSWAAGAFAGGFALISDSSFAFAARAVGGRLFS